MALKVSVVPLAIDKIHKETTTETLVKLARHSAETAFDAKVDQFHNKVSTPVPA